ncbi:MAG: hypothetical protein M3M95_03960 [Pseudomonadota bacterium]|nr:hypothetical protein [Pseudomonadota bacterium]
MPAKTRFDPVQIARAGRVTAGLEGAAATAAGGVLLWGWLFDAERELRNLRCEIAGRVLPVELLDRVPRPDVLEMFASAISSPTPDVGLLGLCQADPDLLRAAGGRVSLAVEAAGGAAATANRLAFEPGSSFEAMLGERLPVRLMRPEPIRRAGEALWAPEAARVLAQARRNARGQRFGPDRPARLSLVVPLGENIAVLGETLAYLDMDPDRSALELVLVLQREEDWTSAETAIAGAATDLPILVVRTGAALSAGVAARVGLDAASADRVVLMSDSVVPPSRGWMADTLEDLDTAALVLPELMPRFDGLPQRFEPRAAPVPTAWPHEDVRALLRAQAARAGLGRWSPGLVAGGKGALTALDIGWSALATADAFWTLLTAEAGRAGAASLRAGPLFTVAPVTAEADLSADMRLLDFYTLADRLGRASGGASVPAAAE